jgi:hypothetical protein
MPRTIFFVLGWATLAASEYFTGDDRGNMPVIGAFLPPIVILTLAVILDLWNARRRARTARRYGG